MVGLVRRGHENAVLGHVLDDVTLSTKKNKTKVFDPFLRTTSPLCTTVGIDQSCNLRKQKFVCVVKMCCEKFFSADKAFAHKKKTRSTSF
jgi:hypothetical protein